MPRYRVADDGAREDGTRSGAAWGPQRRRDPVGADPDAMRLLQAFTEPATVAEAASRLAASQAGEIQAGVERLLAADRLVPSFVRPDLPPRAVEPARGSRGRRAAADRAGPVLLIGGGPGLATSGLVYLGSYLRRHGVEAYVRMENDKSLADARQSLELVMSTVRPTHVGIGLKWFNHIHWSLALAAHAKHLDPSVTIVLGGNTASHYYSELMQFGFIDAIVLGDGEVPLRDLCRGEPAPPNVVYRDGDRVVRTPMAYVQSASDAEDFFLSGLDELFLSKKDSHGSNMNALVPLGKGCSRSCLYCGGGRDAQRAQFGRARPFRRPAHAVRQDIEQLQRLTPSLMFDFDDPCVGDRSAYFREVVAGLDLASSAADICLWDVPVDMAEIEPVVAPFGSAVIELDAGTFSERLRKELSSHGFLKGGFEDREIFDLLARAGRARNVVFVVNGVAGLPFTNGADLAAELDFVGAILPFEALGGVNYSLLGFQPGAPTTEDPERFGLRSPASSFWEYLELAERGQLFPRLCQADGALDEAIRVTAETIRELAERRFPERRPLQLAGRYESIRGARLHAIPLRSMRCTLQEWYGHWSCEPGRSEHDVVFLQATHGGRQTMLVEGSPHAAPPWPLDATEAIMGAFSAERTVQAAYDEVARTFPGLTQEAFATAVSVASSRGMLVWDGVGS